MGEGGVGTEGVGVRGKRGVRRRGGEIPNYLGVAQIG